MTVDKIKALLNLSAYEYKLRHEHETHNPYIDKIEILSSCSFYEKEIMNAKGAVENINLQFVTMDEVMRAKSKTVDRLIIKYNSLLSEMENSLDMSKTNQKAQTGLVKNGVVDCYNRCENMLSENLYEFKSLQDICNEFYPKYKFKYSEKIIATESLLNRGDRALTRISPPHKSNAERIHF